MERIKEGSLSDLILSRYKNKRTITEDEGRILMKQILEAIKYIHSVNIVHRDLKPGNILLKSTDHLEDSIRVIDFGLCAQLNDENDILFERCGTNWYMAPEQLEAKGYSQVL